MELYSKIKLVRKKSQISYKQAGTLAYHIGYVIRVGGCKDYKYADVYFKNHGDPRLIRMNFNKDEKRFMFYDNDNNTKLYYHKTLSENISEKSWVNNASQSGLKYEVDKIAKLEGIDDFIFLGKSDDYIISLVEDSSVVALEGTDKYEHARKRMLENTRFAMYAFAVLEGFCSSSSTELFKFLNRGYSPYIIDQLLPKLSQADLEKFYEIDNLKTKMIKDRNYEKAAEIRDIQREFLDTIKIGSLFNKSILKKTMKYEEKTEDLNSHDLSKIVNDLIIKYSKEVDLLTLFTSALKNSEPDENKG